MKVVAEAGLPPGRAPGILGGFITKNNLVFLALKEDIF